MFIISLFLSLTAQASDLVKNIKINFSDKDFLISVNDKGEIEIDSSLDFFYSENNEPALPFVSSDIAVDAKYEFKSLSMEIDKYILSSNVILASSPIPVTTDEFSNGISATNRKYDNSLIYPESNCRYVGTSTWGGINVLHFLVSPFVYDANSNILSLITTMNINIELAEKENSIRVPSRIDSSILKNIVVNPEVIDSINSFTTEVHAMDYDDQIDYVIITNEELVSSFKPLREWKTIKGIYTSIITVKEIESWYQGNDTQHKIKKCIQDLYLNHGLKYVLLGGDDKVVPVRGCFGSVPNKAKDETIPTDMYYACFGGNFEWDENKNGIYGELGDNIDLAQSVYITRVPVFKREHVDAFVKKLIEYERNPSYNNNMLMGGVNCFGEEGTFIHSDMELQGDNLYKTYIKPYWDGLKLKFYDTKTDFEGDAMYDVSASHLRDQIENGYSFVDIATHGTHTSWKMETGNPYNIYNGASQNNKSHTIVTTIACFTNAFDYPGTGSTDLCLSESLMNNPHSGIIAYLGCSREGWGYASSNLGTSHRYEAEFYKRLFSNSIEYNNYGILVATAKAAFISSSQSNKSWRWVQFGLNPIGDPEMPIWISTPQRFNNIKFGLRNSEILMNTLLDNCKITITDVWDYGEGYYRTFENVSDICVSDIPEESCFCLTRPGFIPKIFNLQILQNKSITSTRNYSNDVILCGSSISSDIKEGPFVVQNGKTTLKGHSVILGAGSRVEKGACLEINPKTFK